MLGVVSNFPLACTVCYGPSESPLLGAARWGIFALLAVTAFVLGCVLFFMIKLSRAERRLSETEANNA